VSGRQKTEKRWDRRTRESGAHSAIAQGNPRRVISMVAPAALLVKLRKECHIKSRHGDRMRLFSRYTHNVPNMQKAITRWDTAHKVARCILRSHHRFGGPMCMGLDEEAGFRTIRGAKKLVASASRAESNCAWEPRRVPCASMSSIFPSKADGGSERLYKSLTYSVV